MIGVGMKAIICARAVGASATSRLALKAASAVRSAAVAMRGFIVLFSDAREFQVALAIPSIPRHRDARDGQCGGEERFDFCRQYIYIKHVQDEANRACERGDVPRLGE